MSTLSRFIKSLGRFTGKLAILSGLGTSLERFCDWVLDWNERPAVYPTQARAVRQISKDRGFDSFPLVLSERQLCPTCDTWVGAIVQPNSTCVGCWARNHGMIIRFQ
jgi:hypothetical protein